MAAVQELGEIADAVEAFGEKAVRQSVKDLAKPVRKQLKADTGGDSRLSRIGNAKLSVSIKVKVSGGTTTGIVQAAPLKLAGPWSWLEKGTRPHLTHGATRRHPGSPGFRTWSKPVDRSVVDVERDMASRWDRTI